MLWEKSDVLWEAKPHTIAKIELLKAYLKPWFAIFGSTWRGHDIVYVDGFCGPGEYTNYPDGSPIAAINAANEILNGSGGRWRAGDVHLVFIDKDKRSIEHLDRRLASIAMHPRINTDCICESFVDGLEDVRKALPSSFKENQPLFVFIDPFGAKGVPFSLVADILSSNCSEVLINLDADGIARIFKAGGRAAHERNLAEIFGDDSWRELEDRQDFHEQCAHVLELYKRKLKSLPNVRYVFSFEMRNKGGLDYFLVFASQHPLGLEKMKEAMRKIDQTGGYQFSDASHGQTLLFRFDKPEDLAPHMLTFFQGYRAEWQEVVDYALNETPFVNPKKMLVVLEKQGLIQVDMKQGHTRARKNTYPDGMVEAIIFGEANYVKN